MKFFLFLLFSSYTSPEKKKKKKKSRIETAHVNVKPVSTPTPLAVFNSFPQSLSPSVISQRFRSDTNPTRASRLLAGMRVEGRGDATQRCRRPCPHSRACSSPPLLSFPLRRDETGAVETKCPSKSSINLVQDVPLS